MSKFDLINGLALRIDLCMYRTKDKKQAYRLLNELKGHMHNILIEDNDQVFFADFERLIKSSNTAPYISNNFYVNKIGVGLDNIAGYSNDFRFEIRWMISCIKAAKEYINEFISVREQYDNLVLLNEYEKAFDVINKFQEEYGTSYWCEECKFFLNSKLGISNDSLLANLAENVYGSVLGFFEYKNRESITSDEYFYVVNHEIKEARKYFDSEKPGIEFMNYMVSGETYQGNEAQILNALKCIQFCSIVDRYIFVIRIANELLRTPESYMYDIMKRYLKELQEIQDNHLKALLFVYEDCEEDGSEYEIKSRLDDAKRDFICGNLMESRDKTVSLLQRYPNNAEAISMTAEISILLNDNQEFFVGTNLGTLIKSLCYVYTLDTKRDDAIEEISKMALVCSMSTWAKHVINDVMGRCYERDSIQYQHCKIVKNLQHLDIETVCTGISQKQGVHFINMHFNLSDEYISFRVALLSEDYKLACKLCNIDSIKDLLFICDNNPLEEKMEHLHPIVGSSASIAVRATSRFLSDIVVEEEPEIFLYKAAELIVGNIYTALFLPWKKIIDYIDEGPTEIRTKIYTPILYYVYVFYLEKTKYDDLGIVCDDFLRLNKIERPSIMDIYEKKYNHDMLVYFLKNVCCVKVLDDALDIFENTQERDKERVEICNILSHIDADNSKEYENEIREITQKLMINRELKIIDESRIHVNSEGIRNKLSNAEGTANRFDKSVKNDFQRYMFYRKETVKHWMKVMGGNDSERYHEFSTAANRMLSELVFKIRDAFVSSDEYGLNGYLSLNIRHNTLDDELRSPFHRTNLYVKKSSNGKYIYDTHWSKNVTNADEEILEVAFKNFYQATETILTKLKTKYIQIKTEKKNEEGLFDYCLFEWDLEVIANRIPNDCEFDEFFDIIINYFWGITELNLQVVKDRIRTEIYQDYLTALKSLSDDIAMLESVRIRRELQQKTKEAESEVYNVLDRISHWFQRSNSSKHSDFDLQFAFDLGLQTIINMHPEKRFKAIPLSETESDKIDGRHLKTYDGMFYNILDNIYKKATPSREDGSIIIRYSLCFKDGQMRIYIENDFDCSKDISKDRESIEQARDLLKTGEYIHRVKGEGGTGIPKIYKILVVDLQLKATMDFGYVEDQNKFYIEINV